MILKNFLSFILLFSTPLLSFSQELLIVQGDTVPKKEKGIWAFKSGDKSIEQWHTRRNTSIKDLTFRKVDLLLHTSCDAISQTYLCISNVKSVQLNSLLQITSIIQPSNKDINEEIKKECESISKADTNVTLIINLKYLLTQSFNLIDENLKDDNVHPKAMSFKNDINDRLCAFIYASDGIVIESEFLNPKRFRLIIDKTPLKDPTEDKNFNYIEPRQYMTIYEKKSYNSSPELIWNLIDDAIATEDHNYKTLFIPNQKQSVIGENSLLEIHFDQKALAENTGFRGNISLKAKSGEKNIEVSPYFVTGEKQKAFGVNSKPIKEIADNYLRLMIEASKVSNLYEFAIVPNLTLIEQKKPKPNEINLEEKIKDELNFKLKEAINNLQFLFNIETASLTKDSTQNYEDKPIDLYFFSRSFQNNLDFILEYISNSELYYANKHMFKITYKELKNQIESLDIKNLRSNSIENYKTSINRFNNTKHESTLSYTPKDIKQNYLVFLKSLDRFVRYMEYFNDTGETTKEAFFSIANMTRIDFNTIRTKVNEKINFINTNYDDWIKIQKSIYNIKDGIDEFEKVRTYLHSLFMYIVELNNQSPQFSGLLKEHGYNTEFLKKQKYETLYYLENFKKYDLDFFTRLNEESSHSLQKNNISQSSQDKKIDTETLKNLVTKRIWKYLDHPELSLLFDSQSYMDIRKQIATWAGEEIFNQLVYATIDLKKQKIKDGDEIEVSLVWYNIFNSNSSEDPSDGVELATAKFIVKKVGWHMDPVESFLLINRLKTEQLDINYPLSPSNYKPTAGASLLWTYHNDYRSNGFPKGTAKWLEPSLGLNVSFPDFNSKKDFEIGVGPIVGLFNNQIFFTGGYNLSVEGLSPWYIGMGFSFSKAYETIKTKAKENEKK